METGQKLILAALGVLVLALLAGFGGQYAQSGVLQTETMTRLADVLVVCKGNTVESGNGETNGTMEEGPRIKGSRDGLKEFCPGKYFAMIGHAGIRISNQELPTRLPVMTTFKGREDRLYVRNHNTAGGRTQVPVGTDVQDRTKMSSIGYWKGGVGPRQENFHQVALGYSFSVGTTSSGKDVVLSVSGSFGAGALNVMVEGERIWVGSGDGEQTRTYESAALCKGETCYMPVVKGRPGSETHTFYRVDAYSKSVTEAGTFALSGGEECEINGENEKYILTCRDNGENPNRMQGEILIRNGTVSLVSQRHLCTGLKLDTPRGADTTTTSGCDTDTSSTGGIHANKICDRKECFYARTTSTSLRTGLQILRGGPGSMEGELLESLQTINTASDSGYMSSYAYDMGGCRVPCFVAESWETGTGRGADYVLFCKLSETATVVADFEGSGV